MARNHLIAIILLGIAVFAYLEWTERYAPPPKPPVAKTAVATPTSPAGTPGVTAKSTAMVLPPAQNWAHVPPPPVKLNPATDDIALQNAHTKLILTRIGARVKDAYVLLGKHDSVELVPPPSKGKPDTEAVYPLGLHFTDPALGDRLNHVRWDVAHKTPTSVTFSLTLPGVAVVRKTIALEPTAHLMSVRVEYTNLERRARRLGIDRTPAYVLYWGPNLSTHEQTHVAPTLVWRVHQKNTEEVATKEGVDKPRYVPDAQWMADKTAYFAVALKPDFKGSQGWILNSGPKEGYRFGMTLPAADVKPGGTASGTFKLYAGPCHLEQLKAAWPTLPSIQRFYSIGILNWFSVLLLNLLNWFHDHVVANYGVAIILLTVLVRMALFPLTIKQIKSMKRMQMLAPEIEELKKKYSDDQQEMNKRMMELYRERGVNPLGGCLPLIVQMPVFFALYRMLEWAFELRGAPFVLWIHDLSRPDHLLYMPWMANVPIVGHSLEWLNLLPILGAIAMILSQKIMPMSGPAQNPQQKMLMTFMPAVFSIFLYNFPSGLNLYILTSTVLGIGQQAFTQRMKISNEPPKKKRSPAKRRSWYAAAQAKKRRQHREIRQAGKRNDGYRAGGTVPGARAPKKGEKKPKEAP